jgi:DNA helicase HerA-like ATPase
VTDDGSVSDLPFGSFADRTVYLIDVANLEEDAQDLLFARVVSKLREQLEHRALGVDHLIVFVDELNKYAASDAPDTYVRQMLLDIAERGRYLGLVLVGAQQFRSQVHRRVTGNSATSLFGRMDPDELASPVYSTLSPALKTRLSTLEKGQLMVRHPHFAQPVFVRFPRPVVLAGRDGLEKFPPPAEVSLDVSVWRALHALDSSITHEWVVKATALHNQDEIIRARNKTVLSRPSDVKTFFARALPAPTATRRAGAVGYIGATVRIPEGDDPYTT